MQLCQRLCGPAIVCWWLVAFLLTLLIECPLLVWLFRWSKAGVGRLLVLSLFANLLTHPAVWFIFPALPLPYWIRLTTSELWAWLGESAFWTVVLAGVGWRRATWASFCSNLTSFGLGWLAYRVV